MLDTFKTAYRHLAVLLKNSGVLPDDDLIFFLTHQEIVRLGARARRIAGEKGAGAAQGIRTAETVYI